ncbi:MAG: DUF1385 domain-containing protein [Fusobacteriaceae bacterium]|nr:DUF1385 domain-containing protein [Fusobacteriaceae bacterium]
MSKINVGGQAVIEGVMMRGPEYIATAVRKPSGEIVYKRQKISNVKNKFLKIPFIRGGVLIFDALVLGVKELTFSANQSEEEEEKQMSDKEAILTAIFSMGLGILLFMVLPSLVSTLIFKDNRLGANILEAVFRILFFVLYIWLISFSKDVKRVFQYHGAEHKSIYAHENGLELNIENAKDFTTLHPRCGTSFLLIVMLVAIVVFSSIDMLLPVPASLIEKIGIKVALRVLLMPLIAGISYELQRYSSKHLDNFFVKMLASPGLALQKITTKEPDEEQIEVAIAALKLALGEEVEGAREIES